MRIYYAGVESSLHQGMISEVVGDRADVLMSYYLLGTKDTAKERKLKSVMGAEEEIKLEIKKENRYKL